MVRHILVIFISLAAHLAVIQCHSFAESIADTEQDQQKLAKKLEALKAEQEYLLFRKTFYESDSKYLVLELSSARGYLMYRNRILRSFRIERSGRSISAPLHGIITMTGKTDSTSKNRTLLFGNILLIQAKKNKAGGNKLPVYVVGKKDLAALYYALEAGAMAYIK
ncbi:MAG: hypothetical protein OEW15_14915 [Nitrospirota bacterium]|nr:hypothetical protein [Nitrospirota bacterium]